MISEKPILTLDTVTRKEAGTYQCKADNGVGIAQFKKIELHINCKYSLFMQLFCGHLCLPVFGFLC